MYAYREIRFSTCMRFPQIHLNVILSRHSVQRKVRLEEASGGRRSLTFKKEREAYYPVLYLRKACSRPTIAVRPQAFDVNSAGLLYSCLCFHFSPHVSCLSLGSRIKPTKSSQNPRIFSAEKQRLTVPRIDTRFL